MKKNTLSPLGLLTCNNDGETILNGQFVPCPIFLSQGVFSKHPISARLEVPKWGSRRKISPWLRPLMVGDSWKMAIYLIVRLLF